MSTISDRDRRILDTYDRIRSIRETARELGIPRSTVGDVVRKRTDKPVQIEFEHQAIPAISMNIDDLLDLRSKQIEQRRAHEEAIKLRNVDIKIEGPFGICHLGDPHVCDDGADIPSLRKHVSVIQNTPGLFASNLGDTLNNWSKGLARLYANQSTTADQGIEISRWLLQSIGNKMIVCLRGNHEGMSAPLDPIKLLLDPTGVAYAPHKARLNLICPNGRTIRIHARHSFKGNSMWSSVHGHSKSFRFTHRDHVLISGHWHRSEYAVVKDPSSSLVSHHCQVGSFKVFDDFAEEHDFLDQQISPSFTTIIDPSASEAGLIHGFFDVEQAADWLTYLRARHSRSKR